MNVLNPSDVFTPATLDFGPRTIRVTHELSTTLVVRSPVTVDRVAFGAGSDVFLAKVRDGSLRGTALRANAEQEVILQFRPLTEATYDTTMEVTFSDASQVQLAIKGIGRKASTTSDVQITPSALVFPETEIDRDVVLPLEVENRSPELQTLRTVSDDDGVPLTSAQPFYLTEAGGSRDALPLVLASGAKARVDLHFRPRAAGMISKELRFYAQGFDTQPADTINVQGTGIEAGELNCMPLRLEFGGLVRGRTADAATTCEVLGGVYTVQRAELENTSSAFQLLSVPRVGTVLNPGDRFDVRARFVAEGEATQHRANLVLTSGLQQTRVVVLEGSVLRPLMSEVAVAVTLAWEPQFDLDLHLVRGGAMPFDPTNDCFYQRKTQSWGQSGGGDDPVLDVDSNQRGPEEVTLQTANDRMYDVYVHAYRGPDMPVTATVTYRSYGVEQAVRVEELARCGALWHVGRIDVNGGVPVFSAVGIESDARGRGVCP